MKYFPLLLPLLLLPSHPCAGPQTPSSAAEILERFRQATGGDAWNQFAECKTEASLTFAGKTGTILYAENFRTGANASAASIPELHVHQSHGVYPEGNWNQDDDGFISLTPPGDPWQADDLYLTRHGYWQPNLAGAAVTVLEPASENDSTFDRLQFQIPGGHGFTLWINRANHFLERVVTDSSTKYLADYRPVDGVMLPFSERKGAGEQQLVLTTTKHILLKAIQNSDFAIPYQHDYDMPSSGSVITPAEGGIVFQASINGKGPYSFLFDTGSVNVLSVTLAKQLGLQLDSSNKQTWIMGGGALDTQTTRIHELRIGALVLHDQLFHVIDIPADSALAPVAAVGNELLRRLAVKVDYQRQQLTFYDAPSFHYSGSGVRVPIFTDGNTLEVRANVGGLYGDFALDTGNDVSFLLNPGFVQQNNLIEELGAQYRGYSGRDYAGPTAEAYYARIDDLSLGEADVHDLIAYLETGQPTAPESMAGNIGRSVLRNFNVTFDAMRSAMYLEKNSNWGKPEIFNRAGILFDPVPGGHKVMTVLPGSPADSAGILPGDLVTRIDGRAPADDITEPAYLQSEGTRVTLTIKRDNSTRELQLTLKNLL